MNIAMMQVGYRISRDAPISLSSAGVVRWCSAISGCKTEKMDVRRSRSATGGWKGSLCVAGWRRLDKFELSITSLGEGVEFIAFRKQSSCGVDRPRRRSGSASTTTWRSQ